MQCVKVRYADEKGRMQEFVRETASVEELRTALTDHGCYVLRIDPVPRTLYERLCDLLRLRRGVGIGELMEFTRLLRTLIKSGLPLKEALDLLVEDAPDGPLPNALKAVSRDVEEGVSFSQALARHPHVFPEIFVRTVVAGVTAGALENVLGRITSYYAGIIAVRRKLVSALVYPTILLLLSIVAVMFMMVKVVPEFTDLFRNMDAPLPVFTQFVLGASELLARWFWFVMLAFAGLAFAFGRYASRLDGRATIDRAKLALPLIGSLEEKFAFSQFARTLATMVDGGIPLLQSMSVVLDSLENRAVAARLAIIPDAIERGESFARAIRSVAGVPRMVPRIVRVGEESGNLGEMLNGLADHYDEEIDGLTSTLTSLIEPLLFLFMAVVVGSVIIALLLPVLTAATNIR
ncbi:MAG TPA: type II secretion system F family protein [Candidatus Ozemobacteraceae bacterium]|nr:type II secretion system F family protein [Candidatus Ozemobacteraceae bacterium]